MQIAASNEPSRGMSRISATTNSTSRPASAAARRAWSTASVEMSTPTTS
jgi:hypothetical protein